MLALSRRGYYTTNPPARNCFLYAPRPISLQNRLLEALDHLRRLAQRSHERAYVTFLIGQRNGDGDGLACHLAGIECGMGIVALIVLPGGDGAAMFLHIAAGHAKTARRVK